MLKIHETTCQSALNSSKIPGMDYCLNPYHGCRHGCGIRKIHPDVIRSTLALIVVSYRIPVIFTQDPRDTAGFLYAAACQEQMGKKQKISLHGEKKPMLLEERQRYLVESLPHIMPAGPPLADAAETDFPVSEGEEAGSAISAVPDESVSGSG